MKINHTNGFIEQALTKVYSRGSRSIKSVADELNINYYTLKNWMKDRKKHTPNQDGTTEKRPQDWTPTERLIALHQSYELKGEALQAWCRQHGLFTHHLREWESAFCEDKSALAVKRESHVLKEENVKLKRELTRKEHALAEAAALLMLQKKVRALWEGEAK